VPTIGLYTQAFYSQNRPLAAIECVWMNFDVGRIVKYPIRLDVALSEYHQNESKLRMAVGALFTVELWDHPTTGFAVDGR